MRRTMRERAKYIAEQAHRHPVGVFLDHGNKATNTGRLRVLDLDDADSRLRWEHRVRDKPETCLGAYNAHSLPAQIEDDLSAVVDAKNG